MLLIYMYISMFRADRNYLFSCYTILYSFCKAGARKEMLVSRSTAIEFFKMVCASSKT